MSQPQYDLFASYACADNLPSAASPKGWISAFLETLNEEHLGIHGSAAGPLRVFFDKREIQSFHNWHHRLLESCQNASLFIAFISQNYFASEWCRREWRTWVESEISKHVLTEGAFPLYIVEVPWISREMGEQEIAAALDAIRPVEPGTLPHILRGRQTLAMKRDLSRRQRDFLPVDPFYTRGEQALGDTALRAILRTLAADIRSQTLTLEAARRSPHNLPAFNRHFTGRLTELNSIRGLLDDDHAGVLTAINSLGGLGKTETAITFGWAYASLYPGGRFLIPCAGLPTLMEALVSWASSPGSGLLLHFTDEERASPARLFDAILARLRANAAERGRTLLILDNIDHAAYFGGDTIRHFNHRGLLHILLTARTLPADMDGQFRRFDLPPLPEDQALELLEKRRPFDDDDEQRAALRLIRELGGFTLAVELVAAYLGRETPASRRARQTDPGLPAVYRMGYQQFGAEHGADLAGIDQLAEAGDAPLKRHNNERRLSAILAPTLDYFQERLGPLPRLILQYATLLPPEHVCLPWIQELIRGDATAPPAGEGPWRAALYELEDFGLLTAAPDPDPGRDPQLPSRLGRCHRYIQEYLQEHAPDPEQTARQGRLSALIRLRDGILETTSQWGEAKWELEPLDALANLWAEAEHGEAAWLCSQIGRRWHTLGQWSRAEPLMRRALAIGEASLGGDHPTVATNLNNLAQLLQATNRLAEAEPLMRRALAIDEAGLGGDHPTVATNLNNLAQLLQATNRLAEAEPLMRRALAIDEASLGGNHPAVAMDLGNLAHLLQATNRLAEAEPLMRRALGIHEASLGGDHPTVATSLGNLAGLLQATNRPTEAEPLMRRALAIDEASLGGNHPTVATNLNNLAQLLQATNRLAEAEPLMRRALAIHEASLGGDHPTVATSLGNLAGLLQATNRPTEAEPLMRRALAIDEASLGGDHPTVATNLNNLAGLLQATNRLAEAEPLMRRALAIDEAGLGGDHPKVAIRLNNLAQLLQNTNRPAEAEPHSRRHVIIFLRFTQRHGHEHSHLRAAIGNYLGLLGEMGPAQESVVEKLLSLGPEADWPDDRWQNFLQSLFARK